MPEDRDHPNAAEREDRRDADSKEAQPAEQEAEVDEQSEESFPASDPPASY